MRSRKRVTNNTAKKKCPFQFLCHECFSSLNSHYNATVKTRILLFSANNVRSIELAYETLKKVEHHPELPGQVRRIRKIISLRANWIIQLYRAGSSQANRSAYNSMGFVLNREQQQQTCRATKTGGKPPRIGNGRLLGRRSQQMRDCEGTGGRQRRVPFRRVLEVYWGRWSEETIAIRGLAGATFYMGQSIQIRYIFRLSWSCPAVPMSEPDFTGQMCCTIELMFHPVNTSNISLYKITGNLSNIAATHLWSNQSSWATSTRYSMRARHCAIKEMMPDWV